MADKQTKNEQIYDAVVRRQIQVVQLGEGQGNQANATINETNNDLKAAIALALLAITSDPTKQNLERLAVLERKIRRIRKPAFTVAEINQNEDMEQLSQAESDWTTEVIGGIAGLLLIGLTSFQIQRIITLIPFAGRAPSQWWESALESDINRTMTNIRAGIQNGLSTREIVESVTGTKTTAGAIKTTQNEVNSLSRTITTGVSNTSQDTVIKKNDDFDRVRWVSILDSRTSTICRGLSGQTWKITEDHPRPPAHPSCRSTLTYLLSGQPLPDDPSYNDWLKRQPESFITSTLPVWQKEQFDKGVPLKAFVTKDIQPLTMVEFKARK